MTSVSPTKSLGWFRTSSEGKLITLDYQTPIDGKEAFLLSKYYALTKDIENAKIIFSCKEDKLLCTFMPWNANQSEVEFGIDLLEDGSYCVHDMHFHSIKKLEDYIEMIYKADIIEEIKNQYNCYHEISREEAVKQVSIGSNSRSDYVVVYMIIPNAHNPNSLLLVSKMKGKECDIRSFSIHAGLISTYVSGISLTCPNMDHLIKYMFTSPAVSLKYKNELTPVGAIFP